MESILSTLAISHNLIIGIVEFSIFVTDNMKDILLIDDDEDEYFIFSDAISPFREKVRCTYACGGERSLELLAGFVPDFIFVDMNMPGMDGIACIGRICSILGPKIPPITLYSTNIDGTLCKRARAAGAAYCLQKTASVQSLVERLSPILLL